MPATLSPDLALEVALNQANQAVKQYNTAVDTLGPSASGWDRIAGQLTVAATKLEQAAKRLCCMSGVVAKIRVRAADATRRASRQRAIAAVQAAAALAGMADFVDPAAWSVTSTMEVAL